MFADYISLVLQDYHQKQAANTLSPLLVHPTPAKLKEECIAVCSERFLRKDEKNLRIFFGQGGDAKNIAHAILRCETDKFKPLVNFLKKQTTNTEDKNIELLAWLINFEPRPFEYGRKYDLNSIDALRNVTEEFHDDVNGEKSETLAGQASYGEMLNTEQQAIPATQINNIKTKIAIIAVIILSVGIGVFWSMNNKTTKTVFTGHEECMYWAGDHYQPISCTKKIGDTLVVALDSIRLNKFKRITTPDTITLSSVGKVWYIKQNGNLEFYTSGGQHPVNPHLKLKPITEYIINKYILAGGN